MSALGKLCAFFVGLIVLWLIIYAIVQWREYKKRPKVPREVVMVSYAEADRMLRANEGWRLAPEEDMNRVIGKVFLERDIVNGNESLDAVRQRWFREHV